MAIKGMMMGVGMGMGMNVGEREMRMMHHPSRFWFVIEHFLLLNLK